MISTNNFQVGKPSRLFRYSFLSGAKWLDSLLKLNNHFLTSLVKLGAQGSTSPPVFRLIYRCCMNQSSSEKQNHQESWQADCVSQSKSEGLRTRVVNMKIPAQVLEKHRHSSSVNEASVGNIECNNCVIIMVAIFCGNIS